MTNWASTVRLFILLLLECDGGNPCHYDQTHKVTVCGGDSGKAAAKSAELFGDGFFSGGNSSQYGTEEDYSSLYTPAADYDASAWTSSWDPDGHYLSHTPLI